MQNLNIRIFIYMLRFLKRTENVAQTNLLVKTLRVVKDTIVSSKN